MPGPPPDDEADLFQLFRGLRERIVHGSNEFVSKVIRGVEERLHAQPEESLAASVLIQLTNLITSWLEPDADHGPDELSSGKQPTASPSPAADDPPPAPSHDDDEP